MKNGDLQRVWKSLDDEISLTSVDELRTLLDTKIRKTINKFNFFIVLSSIISTGYITFLMITAFTCNNDFWYQANNFFVIFLTLISLISSVLTWKKLNQNQNNFSLKKWLEIRIKLLKKEITGNIVWFIIPVFAIPSMLSIHVYYEHQLYLTVLTQEESIFGLISGFIIGGLVAVFAAIRIRKYQKKQLEYLKTIYRRLDDNL